MLATMQTHGVAAHGCGHGDNRRADPPMTSPADPSSFGPATRQALRGWQQRVQAVIDIARDSDDLVARLPVLDTLAHELVRDLERALHALDAAAHRADTTLPPDADHLRAALASAYRLLDGIALWHRPPAVAALRKARDHFRVAADRLPHG